jgi:hypothetical protein
MEKTLDHPQFRQDTAEGVFSQNCTEPGKPDLLAFNACNPRRFFS